MSYYKQRYSPGRGGVNGNVKEHVLIAEAALGRRLPRGAEIHHVDGDRSNNARTNLVICQSIAYHKLLHVRAAVLRAGGDPNTQRICSVCKRVKDLAAFNRSSANKSTGRQTSCRDCQRQHQATYVRRAS